MKIVIDTHEKALHVVDEDGEEQHHGLYDAEAFRVLSEVWLKVGWDLKYTYDFRWQGRPVIQMPEDLIRLQEVVWSTRPDVIVETGVAHGGSAVFFASLLELLGRGKVIAVEVELRPHNRSAIEAHPLFPRIALVDGSSTDPATLEKVRREIPSAARVMVMLDSNHTQEHVARELDMYGSLVSPGCYLVVADGVQGLLHDVPRGKPEWKDNHPVNAIHPFLESHDEFELDPSFNLYGITYFQDGFLRRKDAGKTA
jgi:cephalosporin hydroxylase